MKWWSSNRLRLIQNNLREIDADMNVDLLIQELQEFQANVLMMNAGGIFAFYPSALEHQYVTPYLQTDVLQEAVSKTHEHGMKFIARFDFSKAHESLFEAHPEWFYRDRNGQEVNYYGIVHTCLNGAYQQEKSIETITEVLEKYPVDGIFFNMFGYQHWDYSGNHYGPCYCNNCRRRFQEICGAELLDYTGPEHELHRTYLHFQEVTSRAILENIADRVKSRWPDVAISTYHPHRVDIIRKESNTSLTRSLPLWQYSASENVASVVSSWDDKMVSNCSINAIDLTYRFTGVSPYETEVRLYQNIASGSGLDFCIIGAFEGYPDRKNFEAVRDIFRYHAAHEHIYGNLASMAEVILIKPKAPEAGTEYLGLFKMLKEAHVLFDVIVEDQITAMAHKLAAVKAVILPGLQRPHIDTKRTLGNLLNQGTALLATGNALREDAEALSDWFGAVNTGKTNLLPSAYLEVGDEDCFPSLKDREWITVSGSFDHVKFDPSNTECCMPYIEPASFGPPERAYGHRVGESYGLGISTPATGGTAAYYTWNPGVLYYRHGFEDHKHAVVDILAQLIEEKVLKNDLPAGTELFLNRTEQGDVLLQLLNLSGFNGTTYMEAIPLYNRTIEFRDIGVPVRAYSLHSTETLPIQAEGNIVRLTIPELKRYEAILIEMEHVPKKEVTLTE
ncbi:family 10 glycosylhydrolase [Paenibacillus illinoisensis]|uniref:family 10 glycosylhydrolase n=1 Tax=Paenibacillus illinoisensis TaxID=59845 RepID=UPI003D29AE27